MTKKISPEIILSLQKGEPKAFEEVFTALFNKIKIFIAGYIKSDIDAEELTEDLFVNLWINRGSIDVSKSFNSYIHTMARNAALNYLRHKYVRQSYVNDYPSGESAFSPEEELLAKETSLLIEMAVDKMPEQRKKIYRLSRQQRLKNEEIAIRLNTTKRNVESQLSLALKEIRKAISAVVLFFP